MAFNPEFKFALLQLGFGENIISDIIDLAKHDIVETNEDFIDFINYNIEDGKIPYCSTPFTKTTLLKAINNGHKTYMKSTKFGLNILTYSDNRYPKNIKTYEDKLESFSAPDIIQYMGNIELLKKKSILITGTDQPSIEAGYASRFLGKLLSQTYNIITCLTPGCERIAYDAVEENKGNTTLLFAQKIETLSKTEGQIINKCLRQKRGLCLAYQGKHCKQIEERDHIIAALADCIIVPECYTMDSAFEICRYGIKMGKPVFYFETESSNELNAFYRKNLLELGAKPITSSNALKKIKEAIHY